MKRPQWLLPALLVVTTLFSTFCGQPVLHAQAPDARYYDIGNPTLTDLWVDAVNGNDANTGATRAQALRTLAAAWNRIPAGQPLTGAGRRVWLAQGNYPESSLPNYLEQRYGTAQFPVIFQSADGRGKAVLQGDLNIFDCKYLYLIDLTIRPEPAGDALHLEQCDHVLMRGLELDGGQWVEEGQPNPVAHETLKANQSQYLYLEDCDIHGAGDNAVDFVAVQYGHAVGNRIHNSNDWAMYVKGGSAYLRIEANEFYDAGTGGFTCGQGTGFEFMTSPWLHYEAYDIKVINNLVHDTQGAGLGVNGGYNILFAYNTLYRVGRRSHVLEVVPGGRGCDGDTAKCRAHRDAGGWGVTGAEGQFIPNRNVFIYNNLVYNPAGYQSEYQHFEIRGPVTPPANSNVAAPARSDVNLQIRGNVIWNGPAEHSLGLGEDTGCQPSNPACNETQLRAENAINTVQPQLVNPAGGDFRPVQNGNLGSVATFSAPAFEWSDAPTPPSVPSGNLNNAVARDRNNTARPASGPPGALLPTVPALALTAVSAASYNGALLAPAAIVSAFGAALATGTQAAQVTPLPTTLAGTTVSVRDSAGTARLGALFFVSPTQLNFQIPAGTALGAATVTVTNGGGVLSAGTVTIGNVAPGLFTANASGTGVAAAVALRVRGDGSQQFEPIARFDPALNRFVTLPLDLGASTEQVFLILYGTGFRQRVSASATLGGTAAALPFSGAQPDLAGLDQANVLIPRSLIGRGEVEVVLTVDGQVANPVRVHIR